MTGRLTVLASGSGGNAALLETDGFGLLIDCGLHPRTLSARLREAGASWEKVNAVVLTHIHGDHWRNLTLAALRTCRIPLYAHLNHHEYLSTAASSHESLHRAKLAREYGEGRPLEIHRGLVVRALRVSHDAEPTFAFRIDRTDSQGPAWSIGYASDLGSGSAELIEAFAGVDVLALEFNHDVCMEQRSRRPKYLIDRVLSDRGHLSNQQAGELAAAIVRRSGARAPAHLVQLHLSRECNRPDLAAKAGLAALAGASPLIKLTTALQDAVVPSITLARRTALDASPLAIQAGKSVWAHRLSLQPELPGFE